MGLSTIQAIANVNTQSTSTSKPQPVKPIQLPANEGTKVSLSDEAKKYAEAKAAKAIVENPIAVSAVSDNKQVDELATTLYTANQAQKMIDQYQKSAEQVESTINATA